ncbi:MAG: WYL domain-containing protein [Oscillatoriales cyanobacterium RM2_1_1]|nr:WYL domain-containing protein [Oscillatoriales cyanobacterium RM2_1_1]
MSQKGRSITLSVSEQDKRQLEALALEFGKTWGDRPNISKLIEAIARRELVIAPNHNWSQERIQALNRARTALVDVGELQMALAIAQLLLERSELTIPLRNELEKFLARPAAPWQLQIERYIRQQQPFQLSYQDAAERLWQFTICYAELATHEDRQYLDCWCRETEGNQDLPELQHNWCLRLDRINDAAVIATAGNWRSGLAIIAVELHLFQGLAFAYRSKTARDEVNQWHPDIPNVRRVVRHVSNTFWLIREVLRYGKDCEIVAPEAVREKFKLEVAALHRRYYPET